MQLTLHDNPETVFYDAKDLYEIPMRSPQKGVPNAGGVGKNCLFRPVKESPTQTPYRR